MLVAALSAGQGAAAQTVERFSLSRPEGTRSYLLYRPAGTAGKRGLALVLLLHGGGGSAKGVLERYGWSRMADRHGFLVIAPDGTRRPVGRGHLWNDGSGRGVAARRGIDDVGFLAALIKAAPDRHGADPRRVFVTGFSMGAGMTYLLAASRPDLIAAAAPVSGMNWTGRLPARPVPLMAVFGTADPISPPDGGRGVLDRRGPPRPPITKAAADWARANGCAGLTGRRTDGPVTWMFGLSCKAPASLALLRGVGHHWMGGRPSGLPARFVGPRPDAYPFDTSAVLWRFFDRLYPAAR